MSDTIRRRTPRNCRSRPINRGMARFVVQGMETDRELIRTLARRLAEGGPASTPIRATVSQLIAAGGPPKGRILTALRRSPLADADLQISRERLAGRPQRSHESE
jgi:hypothetical protein